MGKKRVIAEPVPVSMESQRPRRRQCSVFPVMFIWGQKTFADRNSNVYRMKILGTNVIGVDSGQKTLKDAINEAMRDWLSSVETTHYVFGTVAGPHPFPMIVRDFQSVIGREIRSQILNWKADCRMFASLASAVGSNAAGMFYDFIPDKTVQLVGVEAGVMDWTLICMQPVFQKAHRAYYMELTVMSFRMLTAQTAYGPFRFRTGLDYPGVGPEHLPYGMILKRVEYTDGY
jgi:tryptophan synthase beta chain